MRYVAGVLALLVCALFGVDVEAGFLRGTKPIEGRYIVTLHDNVPGEVDALARALTASHGGRLLATMQHAMRGFGIATTEERARALSHHPWVKLVEEDEQFELALAAFDFSATKRPQRIETTTDACPWQGSYYLCSYANDDHWALDRIDNQAGLWSTRAYAYVTTGQGVRAYVVDTGVYRDHQEFYAGQVEPGANMMVDPDIADPVDPLGPEPYEEPPVQNLDYSPADNPCYGWTGDYFVGHGTAVASALAGRSAGVAKRATVVPVKVANCFGERSKLALARGLDWIQADMLSRPGTRGVVNISLVIRLNGFVPNGTKHRDHVCETSAGSSTYTNCVSAIEHEIAQLVSQNVPVVVAAGNQFTNACEVTSQGDNVISPARMGYGGETAFPSTYRTITVGGTMYTSADRDWQCQFTPEGCVDPFASETGSNYGQCVSIWAPAHNVRVAGTNSANSYRPKGGPSSGTSFAAPLVAGVVARLLERYPSYTSGQIWQALVSRANQRYSTPDFDSSSHVNTKLIYMPATE